MINVNIQNVKLLQPWEEGRERSFSMFPGQIEQRDVGPIRKMNSSLMDQTAFEAIKEAQVGERVESVQMRVESPTESDTDLNSKVDELMTSGMLTTRTNLCKHKYSCVFSSIFSFI